MTFFAALAVLLANFADDEVAPEWTVNLTVKFLFPL